MISIVVCSVNQQLFNEFAQSVQSTIGVEFEIVRIDNTSNQYNICQAYNKGKMSCRYEVVCFCHEDILFETDNWGHVVIETLKNPDIGLVGVLGICYYSLFPSDWVPMSEVEGQIRIGAKKNAPTERYSRFAGGAVAEVVVADGVFFSLRKDILDTLRFSDDIFKGFHGYDIDISYQIRQQYKVVITREILIFHHSAVSYNAAYYEAMHLLYIKWEKQLPAYVSAYSKKEIRDLKIRSLVDFIQKSANRKTAEKNLIAIKYAAEHGVLATWLLKQTTSSIGRIFKLPGYRTENSNAQKS